MNRTNTTIAEALPVAIETADPSTEGATFAEAMAAASTLELTGAEWTATFDGFRRGGDESERLEDEIDWIGVGSAACA
jgi:hypothetical protein